MFSVSMYIQPFSGEMARSRACVVCRPHAPDAIHLDARAPRLCRRQAWEIEGHIESRRYNLDRVSQQGVNPAVRVLSV